MLECETSTLAFRPTMMFQARSSGEAAREVASLAKLATEKAQLQARSLAITPT